MTATDHHHMGLALDAARRALAAGEVPIGACLVGSGEVRVAHNRVVSTGDPTAHAEMELIREFASGRRGPMAADTCLYVTVEPCPMCAGACHYAGVGRIVFGASLDDLERITGNELRGRLDSDISLHAACRRDESLALLQAWASRRTAAG